MRRFKLPLILLLLLSASGTYAQDPVSAEEFSQRGISRFEKNDLEGAIADFTKAIELKSQQLEFCYYFRGIALHRRGLLQRHADRTPGLGLPHHRNPSTVKEALIAAELPHAAILHKRRRLHRATQIWAPLRTPF